MSPHTDTDQSMMPTFTLGIVGDLDSIVAAHQLDYASAESYGVEVIEITHPYIEEEVVIKLDVTIAADLMELDSIAVLHGVLIPMPE